MKKILLIFSTIFIFLLSGCTYLRPTPDLVKKYDSLSFKYKEAEHKSWHRKYLNDHFEYDYGIYYEDKSGYYFNIYKDDDLVYSYENIDYIGLDSIEALNNKVYFVISEMTDTKYTTSINVIDESLNHNKIYEVKDLLLTSFSYSNDGITFLTTTRDEKREEAIVKINYKGEVISSFNHLDINGIVSSIFDLGDKLIIEESLESVSNIYLYDINGELISRLASLPNLYILKMEYVNNELYVLGYNTYYKDFDLNNIKIYEYKNNRCDTIFDIDIPDDYGYSLHLVEPYKDDIYLSLSVEIKDGAKSIYSRHLILKCNMKDRSINSIYKNMNLSYNAFYNNGHIYLGNFINDRYVDNVASGEFIDIDLNQFQ